MYSGHDRFVKLNRRGGANKQRGGGKIILKLIDGGARLLETPEYRAKKQPIHEMFLKSIMIKIAQDLYLPKSKDR